MGALDSSGELTFLEIPITLCPIFFASSQIANPIPELDPDTKIVFIKI